MSSGMSSPSTKFRRVSARSSGFAWSVSSKPITPKNCWNVFSSSCNRVRKCSISTLSSPLFSYSMMSCSWSAKRASPKSGLDASSGLALKSVQFSTLLINESLSSGLKSLLWKSLKVGDMMNMHMSSCTFEVEGLKIQSTFRALAPLGGCWISSFISMRIKAMKRCLVRSSFRSWKMPCTTLGKRSFGILISSNGGRHFTMVTSFSLRFRDSLAR
mmetsp:Transcript_77306/g.165754  ORF Transcript_77306/g.165754 Transcript_77306/m.165754 type:complete len:215 (-) Transcript_77306:1349-1993(-)